MAATILYMSMSLDGFLAGPNEGPDNGLGEGGHRLHQWSLDPEPDRKKTSGNLTGVNGRVMDEFLATGAVVAGRGTIEPAGFWGGDHHYGVPIFTLTRRDPGEFGAVAARHLPDSALIGAVYAARQLASDALDVEEHPDLLALGDDVGEWMADLFR